jgi:hypothetical protein
LALAVIQNHHCVVIGLEIASNQQDILDAMMQGRAAVDQIALWPQVDHPPYRRMLESFAEHKRQGKCIKVVAIDSGVANVVDRDLWMALSLAEQTAHADTPILVLLGGLHTLQRVAWTVSAGKPSVAEILVDRGFRVKTFPQSWIPYNKCAGNNPRISSFVNGKSLLALTILNDSLMSLINARRPKSTSGVVDGFIVWECDSLPRGDLPHSIH